MYVTVHLSRSAKKKRAAKRDAGESRLSAALAELGVQLEPLHPGSSDPELASQFYVSVADEEDGERVATRLRSVPGVEAAYLKPPDEPPG
jgi:hypothetical protein